MGTGVSEKKLVYRNEHYCEIPLRRMLEAGGVCYNDVIAFRLRAPPMSPFRLSFDLWLLSTRGSTAVVYKR